MPRKTLATLWAAKRSIQDQYYLLENACVDGESKF